MFKLILAASLVALAVAQYGSHGYGAQAHGNDYAHHPIPYQYGYDIVGGDAKSGDFKQTREEKSDGNGNVQGSYSYTDAHGNNRVVNYVADGHGFRAQVQTNEPGTESQNPADVEMHSTADRHHQYGHAGHAASGPRPSYGGHGLY